MLELRDVNFRVIDKDTGEERDILRDVNLTVDNSELIVITGPNGSGKSTLAKVIMGLVEPTSGRILFNGQDITDLPVDERSRLGISFAFQQPVRFKGLRVKDMLQIAAGKELGNTEACHYLAEVGLCAQDYIERDLDESLSGGEMKRVEIAQLLARNTKLSIFDEPEAGIDLWSFKNLIEVFEFMQANNDGAIMIISHQERILQIADRILLLSDGTITKDGSREEMMKELITLEICEYKKVTL